MNIKIYLPNEKIPDAVILPAQCHGNKIVEIVTGEENLACTDAMFTRQKEITLGIQSADCAAILFQDSEKIGIAHVGWRGLCAGLIPEMLAQFSEPEIFVGPCMHEFEIQKDFCYDAIQDAFGLKYISAEGGKVTFHFKDAIASFLSHATFDPRNTFLDDTLPSYRRNKTAERIVTTLQI